MLNAERGDCASVAKIIEQQAALTEQGQQAVRDTSQDSLGGEQSILATVIISAVVKRSIGSTTGCTITEKAPTRR